MHESKPTVATFVPATDQHEFISDCEMNAECAACGEYAGCDIHNEPYAFTYEQVTAGIPICEEHDGEC